MTDVRAVLDDLVAEQDALDAVVAALDDEAWSRATPSPRWTVADQIAHLAYFDRAAAMAITDPDGFASMVEDLFAAGTEERADDLTLAAARSLSPSELLDHWRAGRRMLAEAAAGLEAGTRIGWYGPSMGAKSFLTARLMECWAHGQDIVDSVDGERPATDRLRHIAQLGVITRDWAYVNRGEEPPAEDVLVRLTGPSGEEWAWGPEAATASVVGGAEDFCLVVTQRRHVDDTDLEVTGEAARHWLDRAQAFAGPATDGPSPRGS
jgi:uncharacterized protein (TIGR03084 family)